VNGKNYYSCDSMLIIVLTKTNFMIIILCQDSTSTYS